MNPEGFKLFCLFCKCRSCKGKSKEVKHNRRIIKKRMRKWVHKNTIQAGLDEKYLDRS